MTSDAELNARLADLSAGPFRAAAQPAREALTLKQWSSVALARVLRPNIGRKFSNQDDINFRESFDESLDFLELLELAVETGYLTIDSVRDAARNEMELLLKPRSAQRYLVYYDFLLVRFLAARLDFPLFLPRLEPPVPNPEAQIRFAVFLATHNDWSSDPHIELFTRLLDSYQFYRRIDAAFFSAYLLGAARPALRPDDVACIQQLSDGLDRFVQLLGGLFAQLSPAQRPYFGSFYAYWLAKFFGYRLQESGYEQASESWGKTALALYSSLPDVDAAALFAVRKRREMQLATMQETWHDARELLQSSVGEGRKISRAQSRPIPFKPRGPRREPGNVH